MKLIVLLLTMFAGGCAVVPESPPAQQIFFDRLLSLCGRSFEGRLASGSDQDRAFAGQALVAHVRTCSANEVRIPFHVGEDRSRTWVIRRTTTGLTLHHVHRHSDGSEDVLSRYGGATVNVGTSRRQEYPADDFSRALFDRQNIPQSTTNVWALEVVPDELMAYELRRPGRFVRVEFDLSRQVSPPPAPWGER